MKKNVDKKHKKLRAEFSKAVKDVNTALDFFNERLNRIETEMQLHRTIVKDKLMLADLPRVENAKQGVQRSNGFWGMFS